MMKFLANKKKVIIKGIIVIAITALVIGGIYLLLKNTGLLEKVDNVTSLKELILSSGIWCYLVFVILQFLQVTFLPIPATITTIAGTILFGPWIAFVLSYLSVMLGSLFAFYLGRKFGKNIVAWVAGEEQATKLTNKLTKCKYMFFLMMLFPFFPDDILCIVAGTTNITPRFFIITNIITRAVGLFGICFFSSGIIIPYNSWGIPVWIAIGIILLILFIVSIKYQDKIENYIINKFKKNEINSNAK